MLLLLSLVMLTAVAAEPVVPQCPSSRHPRKANPHHPSSITHHPSPTTQHPTPYQGDKRQLVFLVAFSDQQFMDEDPAALWGRIFNEEHLSEEPFYGSVHDYFYDQSYGQFNLTFDLHYVAVEEERAKYRSGYLDDGTPDDSGAGLLLCDLLDSHKDDIPDWSVYDWNDDGYVDQILILFAGKGQNNGGGSNTIWANQWRLSEQSEEPFYREWGHPYEVCEGLLVDNYGVFPELTGKNTYGTFGTLCHEYGHCLGLPDFYYGSATQVVGRWDIMDYGNYNDDGFCPPGYSAHERMYLGWLDAKELTESTSVTALGPLVESGEAYLIRNDGWADEYYVIENRQQTGWDKSLPGSGILVFHVDYDEEVWRYGIPNSRSLLRYSIIPANGSSGIREGWGYPYMSNGMVVNDMLTNDTKPAATLNNPNIDGQKLMSKPVTNMKVENGLASFDVKIAGTSIRETGLSIKPQVLYEIGPVTILRAPDGKIIKVVKR